MTPKKLCLRDGCSNPLHTGSTYCSRSCANLSRSEKIAARKEQENEFADGIEAIRSGAIPAEMENALLNHFGHDWGSAMLGEMESQWLSDRARGIPEDDGAVRASYSDMPLYDYSYGVLPYLPSAGITIPRGSKKPPQASDIEPYTPLMKRAGGYLTDTRRDSKIPYSDIDRMMSLGPCLLASRLKQGPILSALASPRKWSVRSPDAKLRVVSKADLQAVFLRSGRDFMTSMAYGAAFGSVVWTQKRADEIGDLDGVGKSSKWWVVDRIDWAHPSTVRSIIRKNKDRQFAGFVHKRHQSNKDVAITPPGALLITYDGRFGDLWGTSMFNASYDFAVWYERVMIGFLRFLDEDANKKVVVRGPSKGTRVVEGQKVSNPEYALMLGASVREHGVLAIPSEHDIHSGKPVWEVEYLKSDQIGTQFIEALRYLSTEILRASVIGDNSVTQNSSFGGNSSAGVHQQVTQIDNMLLFVDLLSQLNEHLAPRYGQFNRNYNNPPAVVIEAEVVDFIEQEILMSLVNTVGNIKIGEGTPADRIDWDAVLRGTQIPTLSDEQMQRQLEKMLDESKKRAGAFGLNKPPAPGQNGEPAESAPIQNEEEKEIEAALHRGEKAPALITSDRLAEAVAAGVITEEMIA